MIITHWQLVSFQNGASGIHIFSHTSWFVQKYFSPSNFQSACIKKLYLFHFFTLWLLLELNDCDRVGLAGPLDESLTPHLAHGRWLVRFCSLLWSSCHLVVPQILGCLLCGALGVPHQAALFIVHLLRKCYFSPSILPKFTCWQTSWLLGSHSLFVLYLHTSSCTTQCQRHPLQFLSTWPSSQTTGS